MGMDVYGRKPTTEAGQYFRNNVWWWHPLATYIQAVAPALQAHCRYWHTNDGAGLNASNSLKLAAILREQIASGRTAEYAMNRLAATEAEPRRVCSLCDGTGIRTDAIGVDAGQPQKPLNAEGGFEPTHPRFGQLGWCNACDGIGTRSGELSMYPFFVENVAEFCTFLEGSGGFKIC